MKIVRRTWSAVRCASAQPFQSLYLLTVRRSVGRPLRQEATVANSLSNCGSYSATEAAAQRGVTFDQSANVDVASLKDVPHWWSLFSSKLLCAIATMMASAALT